jgi:hypothetical protein
VKTISDMTPEQLLIPRVMIIAPWPKMEPYQLGDILHKDYVISFQSGKQETLYQKTKNIFHMIRQIEIDKHPHLVRKLEWWEYRELADMPRYLRNGNDHHVKVDMWYQQNENNCYPLFSCSSLHLNDNYIRTRNWLPATEQGYNEYCNQKLMSNDHHNQGNKTKTT